jgi:hypothetical protein
MESRPHFQGKLRKTSFGIKTAGGIVLADARDYVTNAEANASLRKDAVVHIDWNTVVD